MVRPPSPLTPKSSQVLGYTRVEAARNLGVDRQLIGRWLKEEEKSGEQSFRGQGKLTAEQMEIRRLKEEVRHLKMEASIYVRYRKKYKVTTNSNHKKPLFENVLNRQFKVDSPNQAYVSDITYLWTQEGWLYLAVVIDLFSRKVVGWSMSPRMRASLVCDALRMAIWQRKPKPGLIIHSDRGRNMLATLTANY